MRKTPHELREIAAWMAATEIAFLELRMPDATVRLGRRGDEVLTLDDGQQRPEASPVAHRSGATHHAGPHLDTVTSASLGVFLHAHPCATVPFVRAGAQVQPGQTLGLLRIGVLLLPVAAPRGGIVAALLVDDGATVGYGAALVDLDPL
jgi:acetyl-CoA carboxylase biotin carboxyl carrier protein